MLFTLPYYCILISLACYFSRTFWFQEQLRHKAKFNIIAFNSKVIGWRDRLIEVSERSLQSAWTWIQGLSCWGSTNTKAAIQTALSDAHTQAIYLLTDGRPDQVTTLDGFFWIIIYSMQLYVYIICWMYISNNFFMFFYLLMFWCINSFHFVNKEFSLLRQTFL